MPATGKISMAGLNDLVTFSNTQLYQGWKSDGVVSGGFYFEWTDEWWKQTPTIQPREARIGATRTSWTVIRHARATKPGTA